MEEFEVVRSGQNWYLSAGFGRLILFHTLNIRSSQTPLSVQSQSTLRALFHKFYPVFVLIKVGQ